MEVDDNELTSLTWLHSINILPPRRNNVSNKRRNDQLKHQSSKKSSEKTNTGVKGTTFDISINSNYCTINEDINLTSAQNIDKCPETITSKQNDICNLPSTSRISQSTADLNKRIDRKVTLIDPCNTKQDGKFNPGTKNNVSQNYGSLNVSIPPNH